MGIQGEEDAQNSNRLSDFSKNAAARIFLDGAIGVINHKDQGILMKEMALQAMKPQSGSTSGKKTSEAQDAVLPKHSADLYHYDQTFYRKWIHMFGHTGLYLLLLTDRMVQKMQKSVLKSKYSDATRKLIEGLA